MLSAADTERLNELPDVPGMAIENDCCQLLPGHAGSHVFAAQREEVAGEDYSVMWWVRWECQEAEETGYELVRARACDAVKRGDVLELFCELPVAHEGPHRWG